MTLYSAKIKGGPTLSKLSDSEVEFTDVAVIKYFKGKKAKEPTYGRAFWGTDKNQVIDEAQKRLKKYGERAQVVAAKVKKG